jgi:hypothetical protein
VATLADQGLHSIRGTALVVHDDEGHNVASLDFDLTQCTVTWKVWQMGFAASPSWQPASSTDALAAIDTASGTSVISRVDHARDEYRRFFEELAAMIGGADGARLSAQAAAI